MAIDQSFYFNRLYPFQDRVLHVLDGLETGFYLTGGTAASRGYLHHRFSDDLDLFVNDDDRFQLWSQRLIQALVSQETFTVDVLAADERFARLNVARDDLVLKIDMVNDVPARVGTVSHHPQLGRLDSAANILANKITALTGREEPKDFADIWGFCCQMDLAITNAIEDAHSKAAGIFPADLARILYSVTKPDWQVVKWIAAPPFDEYIACLHALSKKLLIP